MGRVKTVETVVHNGTAIQFVRNAIGDVYEFNEMRDMSVFFKNDKFTGTIVNEKGVVVPLTGKDWIVKSDEGAIITYSPAAFDELYHITGEV